MDPTATPGPTPDGEKAPSGGLELTGLTGAWEQVLAPQPADSTQTGPSPATPSRDTAKLFGRYRILSELGRGGMGVVYKAWDPSLGREVALKRMKGDDPELAVRFLREAQVAARLKHPGIVGVYDFGEVGREPFFTMELVEGRSLADALARTAFAKARGESPAYARLREEVRLVAEVARAIGYLHAQGLVHRDLKPSNVLIDGAGMPRVTDFGLVRESSSGGTDLTRSGAVMGTPSYMSPEQARGQARAVTAASDVFSLGVLLYEVLSGTNPFATEDVVETLRRIQEWDPPPPSAHGAERSATLVPRALDAICLKAIEKTPSRRYAEAGGLAEDLERFLRGEPVTARPPSAIERALRWTRKRRLTVGIALAVVVTGALLAVPLYRSWARSRELADRMARRAAAQPYLDEAWQALVRAGWLFNHGKLHAVDDELHRARSLAREAVRRFADDARAHALLAGVLYRDRGHASSDPMLSDCLREAEIALSLDPHEPHALFYFSAVLVHEVRLRAMPQSYRWMDGVPPRGEEDAEVARALERVDQAVAAARSGATDLGPFERGVLAVVEADAAMWRKDEKATMACLASLGIPASQGPPSADQGPRLLEDVEERGYRVYVELYFTQLRDVDRAARACEEALLRWEDHPRFLDVLASCHSAKRKYPEAEAVLTHLLEASPGDADEWGYLAHRASVRCAQEKFDEGAADYLRAAQLHPQAADLWTRLGIVEVMLDRKDQAIEHLRLAVSGDPNDHTAWAYLANLFRQKGDYAPAVEAYSRSLALVEDVRLLVGRATAYRELGDFTRAEADDGRAVTLVPGEGTYWYLRGWDREEGGRYAGALSDYVEAERLLPDDPDCPLRQAAVLERLGRLDEAGAAAQRAIDRAPEGWNSVEEARSILQRAINPK